MILRKRERWGRPLFYPVNQKDVWITVIQGQTSLTEHDVKYLKQTGRFTFELMREEI